MIESKTWVLKCEQNPSRNSWDVEPVKPTSLEEAPFTPVEEVKDLKELAAKLRSVNEFAEVKRPIKCFLKEYVDLFTWTHRDMLGIDPGLIAQELNVKKDAKPMRQKR
ncbi:hypothetical protein Patl1_35221 [Pistacia atlantica]|uniref:Uncharacterized protein n=1 Tax=Pistacia atlantica TaxID=434234 RepID=A0ACC0ZWX7_9ROSI|nr:hypothetical protein Patl1_35221 [Pistacia atlantica]